MLQDLKGQAAIEYMTVFGLALLLASPFVLKAQSSINDLRANSNAVVLQNGLNDIETAAETVNAAGEPATRTFFVRFPETTKESWVFNRALVVQLATADSRSNYTRVFDFNITGELPDQGGRHRIKTTANNSKVVIEVVS